MSRAPRARGTSNSIRAGLGLVIASVSAAVVLAPPPSVAAAGTTPRCTELAGGEIPASAISLPTKGGRVESASLVTQVVSGETVEYCRVDAALLPVDRSAPNIKLRIGMPVDWNRKAMMFGGGGYNGTIPDIAQNVPFGRADRLAPLARGYATFASDSGHQAGPTGSLDGSFGVNDEAVRNFAAGDALRKTRDAAMFLIRHAYGAGPGRSYFGWFDRRSRGPHRRATVARRLRWRHLRLPCLEQHGRDPGSRVSRAGDVPTRRVPGARKADAPLQQRCSEVRRAGRAQGQGHLE